MVCCSGLVDTSRLSDLFCPHCPLGLGCGFYPLCLAAVLFLGYLHLPCSSSSFWVVFTYSFWVVCELGQRCFPFAPCAQHSLKIVLWCLWIDWSLSLLTQYLNPLSIETWNNSLTIVFRLVEFVCFMSNFGLRVSHWCAA